MEDYKEFCDFKEDVEKYKEDYKKLSSIVYVYLYDSIEKERYRKIDFFLFRYVSMSKPMIKNFRIMLFYIIAELGNLKNSLLIPTLEKYNEDEKINSFIKCIKTI